MGQAGLFGLSGEDRDALFRKTGTDRMLDVFSNLCISHWRSTGSLGWAGLLSESQKLK